MEDQHKRKKQEDLHKERAARLQKGSDVPESVDVAELMVGHCSVAEEDVSCGTDGTVVPVKKKIKKTAARKLVVGEVTPRRSPRVSRPAEVVEDEGLGLGGTPRRSPRVLATAAPTPSPLGAGASGKGKKCGVKRKVPPAKVNKGVKKRSRVNPEDKDDAISMLMTRTTTMMILPLIRYECLMFTIFRAFVAIVVVFVFLALPWRS